MYVYSIEINVIKNKCLLYLGVYLNLRYLWCPLGFPLATQNWTKRDILSEKNYSATGLPDGMFLNQKSKFGKILEGLGMKKIGIFYGHLV
jgi:hypothetical protein